MGWAVAITHVNSEKIAVANATRQGFACYLPEMKSRSKGGKRRDVIVPLFSRYVFVQIVDAWHSLLGTKGVAGLIMAGNSPSLVGDDVIEEIQSRCDKDGFFVPAPRLIKGEQVVAKYGAMAGVIGIYDGMTSNQREVALMEILGSKRRVEFERGNLVAA